MAGDEYDGVTRSRRDECVRRSARPRQPVAVRDLARLPPACIASSNTRCSALSRAGVRARAEAAAEERILDAMTGPGSVAARESFRRKLRAGELDDKEVGLTVVGFLRGTSMVVYSRPERIGR